MIVHSPDGTIPIQKPAKDAKAKNSLIVPPQVIVPFIPPALKPEGLTQPSRQRANSRIRETEQELVADTYFTWSVASLDFEVLAPSS